MAGQFSLRNLDQMEQFARTHGLAFAPLIKAVETGANIFKAFHASGASWEEFAKSSAMSSSDRRGIEPARSSEILSLNMRSKF